MTRHAKNNTANPVFTYHERLKIKGAGTQKVRLGKENLRQFEDCWLCLRTAEEPIVTPYGFVYCKNCLYLNLGHQRTRFKERHDVWMTNKKVSKELNDRHEAEVHQKKLEAFERANLSAGVDPTLSSTAAGSKRGKFNKAEARSSSFWVSENAPSAAEVPTAASDTTITAAAEPEPILELLCPMANKQIRLKQLVALHPEFEVQPAEVENDLSDEDLPESRTVPKKPRWICSFSGKLLAHQKAVCEKKTGKMYLLSCLAQKLVKNATGVELTESDVIPLKPGGTSFSAHNVIEAKLYVPKFE